MASAVGLLLGGLVLLIALRRALRPVHDLATAARSVDLNDLSSRVPEPVTDDEVAGMAREFNRMLDRIRDDERHRQQLLSAISHELRTPLAVARGHLELLRDAGTHRRPLSGRDGGSGRGASSTGSAASSTTSPRSTRARPARTRSREPVFAPDVTAALQDRLDGLNLADVEIRPDTAGRAARRRGPAHPGPGQPGGERPNAYAGGHAGHRRRDGDRRQRITFRVRDSGPGIDPSIRSHVFDPFVTTKSDGAGRTSGLGLSVVKAITEAQGGTVTLTSDPTGTSVSLALPLDTSDLRYVRAGYVRSR